MPDHVNIGVSFMRQLKLQINYDEVSDEIWSPFLGHLVEADLVEDSPPQVSQLDVCNNVYDEANSDSQLSAQPGRSARSGAPDPLAAAQQQLPVSWPVPLAQPQGNTTQPEDRRLWPMRPGGNAELQLIWDDLEQGVDVLGEDGAP